MKELLFITIMMLVSFFSFSKKTYTMTKTEFAGQFNESCTLKKVYCTNEAGEKVWLYCNDNTILTLSLSGGKTEKLILNSIKLKGEKIDVIRYDGWGKELKIRTIDFNEVTSIIIRSQFQEYERSYFNLDSCRNVAKQRNDSLKYIYSLGNEYIIQIDKTKGAKSDTIRIRENACYNLTFSDANITVFGVVHKITKDSIWISNFLSAEMAAQNKKQYEHLSYPIVSIKELSLLKSGGYSYNNISLDKLTLKIENISRKVADRPYWFAVNPLTGAVKLYRLWQRDSGYSGITETNGKAIWYEGEVTE